MMKLALIALCAFTLAGVFSAMADELQFENLGVPVTIRELSFRFVSQHPDGGHIAWSHYQGDDRRAVVGVRTDTGVTTWVDVGRYGSTNIRYTATDEGQVYIYTGKPGHFLRHDPTSGETTDLGVPGKPASYWMHDATGPDGVWYVGTYPRTYLMACDLKTGEIRNLGKMAEDGRERYITRVAVSDDNVIYCAVGLHHRELWAYDARSGEKHQILPDEMTEPQGAPSVWTGTDGKVYGRAGSTRFQCRPDGIVVGETLAERRDPDAFRAGEYAVGAIDNQGKLRLTNTETKEASFVQTDYEGRAVNIYSVACEREGKVYGGTVFPGKPFSCDTQTGELSYLGDLAPGAIQIYDIIDHPKGLFLASYMGCKLDVYDPDSPIERGVNPHRITSSIKGHERPNQWEKGPDGKLYFGTYPAKGRLGGALVQVDPETLTFKTWPNIVTDQSIPYLTAIPETGELLGCATVGGGSSAVPSQKEACVFLWDIETEKVVWTCKPIEGARTYLRAIRTPDGLVYGVVPEGFWVIDPEKRQVVATGELPVKTLRFPVLADAPVGPRGLIVGLGDDAVFAIDPADNSATVLGRHESIARAHGFCVSRDGALYYGSGANLWRCELPLDR